MADLTAQAWRQLVSIATLGVARAAPGTGDLWPEGVTPMPAGSAADTLLRAAVTGHLWQSAGGRTPAGAAPEVAPAPSPARPPVSDAAAWRLIRMVTGTQPELIPEWFAVAEEAQRELPVHCLPTVLPELDEEDRQRFAGVLGPQAAWLGALNPRWSTLPPLPSEEFWSSGTLPERVRQLTLLRRQDPARAREWLLQSWPSETPDGRTKLAPVLSERLGAADEPFLEHLLDDTRKEVRSVAVGCLCRLPASAHALRNQQRLAALITADVARGRGRKRALTLRIELPETPDAAAQRDGIELRRPAGAAAMGERAWWLWQMMARTPPRHWTERFPGEPEAFLDALLTTDHGAALLTAVAAAAERHPDAPWVGALCARLRLPGKDVSGARVARMQTLSDLLAALPAPAQGPILEGLLKGDGAAGHELLAALLAGSPAWSAPATTRALTWLMTQVRTNTFAVRDEVINNFARRADLAAAAGARSAILGRLPADASPFARGQLEQMIDILEFRALMRQELTGDG